MAFQYSVDLRNAGLDARIAAVGPNATLRLYAGRGRQLASLPLGTDWMSPAKDGVATNSRPWTGHGNAEGKATSFSICDAAGQACILGSIPDELKLDNPNIAVGQAVTVSVFTIVSGNG